MHTYEFPYHVTLIILFTYILLVAQVQANDIPQKDDNVILDLDISEILKEQEINAIYSDTRVTGKNLESNEKYINDYYSNGTVKSKRKNKIRRGIWFIDENGQHCVRWNHKNTANCEMIGMDDDGNWVKFKDDEITKEIESFRDIPIKSN